MPLVSIVIPVYNGANYMREAIDSALNQTYKNIEILVVNDGSTDDGATERIALSYQDRIRYYHKENGGVSSALNYGIQHMHGEYFAWLSHDDIHLPQKVEKQMEAIFKHDGGKPVICVCNYYMIDASGKEFNRCLQNTGQYFQKSYKCFLGGETGLMIDGDATIISKQVFDACGVFDEGLFASQETDMWVRAYGVADFIFIQDYLVGYRCHPQQVARRRSRDVGLEAGIYRGNLLRQATLEETQDYFGSEVDAFRLGISAYEYLNLFFYEASHQIIIKIRQLALINWKYLDNALAGMFRYSEIEEIHKALVNDISAKSHKTKILLVYQDCVAGDLADRFSDFIMKMQQKYDMTVVHYDDNTCAIPNTIPSIRLRSHADGLYRYSAVCLAVLAELLNVDILWCNNIHFMRDEIVMSHLKDTHIRTIASFHYSEQGGNTISAIHHNDDAADALSDASIITFEENTRMFSQYLYPYDSVLLPTISGNDAVCKKWDRLFKALLSSDNDQEKLYNGFTHVNRLENTSQPADIIERIQPYLDQYADHMMEKYRVYYEQSIYWKISRPLRFIADIIRKLIKPKR